MLRSQRPARVVHTNAMFVLNFHAPGIPHLPWLASALQNGKRDMATALPCRVSEPHAGGGLFPRMAAAVLPLDSMVSPTLWDIPLERTIGRCCRMRGK